VTCCGAYCSEVCNCLTIAASLELERRARERQASEGPTTTTTRHERPPEDEES